MGRREDVSRTALVVIDMITAYDFPYGDRVVPAAKEAACHDGTEFARLIRIEAHEPRHVGRR